MIFLHLLEIMFVRINGLMLSKRGVLDSTLRVEEKG